MLISKINPVIYLSYMDLNHLFLVKPYLLLDESAIIKN